MTVLAMLTEPSILLILRVRVILYRKKMRIVFFSELFVNSFNSLKFGLLDCFFMLHSLICLADVIVLHLF